MVIQRVNDRYSSSKLFIIKFYKEEIKRKEKKKGDKQTRVDHDNEGTLTRLFHGNHRNREFSINLSIYHK